MSEQQLTGIDWLKETMLDTSDAWETVLDMRRMYRHAVCEWAAKVALSKRADTTSARVAEFLREWSQKPYPDSDLNSYIESFRAGCAGLLKELEGK